MLATITTADKVRPIVSDMEPGAPFALANSPTHVFARIYRHQDSAPMLPMVTGALGAVVLASAEAGSRLDSGAFVHLAADQPVIPLRQVEPIAFVETESTRKE